MKKLSDVRPCDRCGGPITPLFYIVRFSVATVKQSAINNTLGLAQMLGGSLQLAEVLTPEPDAVLIAMDSKDPEQRALMTEAVLCNDCYCGDVNLAVLAETIAGRQAAKERRDGT